MRALIVAALLAIVACRMPPTTDDQPITDPRAVVIEQNDDGGVLEVYDENAPDVARKQADVQMATHCAPRQYRVTSQKDSVENEEFFAAWMDVRRERALRGVSNDGRCARDLVTDTVEHSALDTRHWRAHPGQFSSVDRGTLGEVGVDPHDRLRLRLRPGSTSRPPTTD